MVVLLLASSAYWTWRLHAKLADEAPRAPQEVHRLWLAWGLLGIAPTIAFFVAMYQSIVVVPSRFIERLNRSLAYFNVAYSAEVRQNFIHTTTTRKHNTRQDSLLTKLSYTGVMSYRQVGFCAYLDRSRRVVFAGRSDSPPRHAAE